MFFVKFFINFGLKITLRRFYKKSNIRDRQEKYSILKKSKHSFDNLMNFKNTTENTSLFQDLLFAKYFVFHETTRNSKVFKIPNELFVRFSHSKNKIFLTIVAPKEDPNMCTIGYQFIINIISH